MTDTNTVTLTIGKARDLCEEAAIRAGANPELARSIAVAAVRAEAEGQASVGLGHFIDYLASLREGRIDGRATPLITRPAPAIILSDARGGAAHPGFDRAFDDLVATAKSFGLALFVQKNAYTCGALGPFAARLAEVGLVGLAATNGPALLAGSGATRPVYCTNPMAFAAPVAGGPPLLIDQSSSATAFVNVRQAARENRPIPSGWALDADGNPTTDPEKAMAGALLAFGGARGANLALMVEVLSAGVSGAKWSLDAASISKGSENPGTGLFVLAIAPALVDPDFATRMAAQLSRLSGSYGVHVPGPAKAKARERAERHGITVSRELYERIAG
ncbi:Ldh family oxidoreductase [Mesorhizobium sp. LHD-90]|uniref:Ldh family oxidoreductase n=1 Tax=Mesorhizobium sp. LHD-90 TaxID=3071414 RepID=UPI0027E18372|nr:Ldh family oxidoreductase [Mesorhizobium sp. LHD-90]MDQ6435655.1 Ldh family oxidoreductase [Mesorhizobium sp. LHD-90]